MRFIWSEVTESPRVMIPKSLLCQMIACYNKLCDHHRLNNVKKIDMMKLRNRRKSNEHG